MFCASDPASCLSINCASEDRKWPQFTDKREAKLEFNDDEKSSEGIEYLATFMKEQPSILLFYQLVYGVPAAAKLDEQ